MVFYKGASAKPLIAERSNIIPTPRNLVKAISMRLDHKEGSYRYLIMSVPLYSPTANLTDFANWKSFRDGVGAYPRFPHWSSCSEPRMRPPAAMMLCSS